LIDPAVACHARLVISFTIHHVPVAQPRQRHKILGSGNTAWVHNYTPKKSPVASFKAETIRAARAAHSGEPLTGPVRVEIDCIFPRPKAKCWKTRSCPREWHTGTPDAENVAKALLDSLTALIWKDDRQVAELFVRKEIAAGGEHPHVVVQITPL
jgi:Holliday junction resolvase RusA-like endonuclease